MNTTLFPNNERAPKVRNRAAGISSVCEPKIVSTATREAVRKLNPTTMVRNPVMLIVEAGSVLTTMQFIRDFRASTGDENLFAGLVAAWLWFTVLFANFAEALAEGRGKA